MDLRSNWKEIKENSRMYQQLKDEGVSEDQLESGKITKNGYYPLGRKFIEKTFTLKELKLGRRLNVIHYLIKNQLAFSKGKIQYDSQTFIDECAYGDSRQLYNAINWLEENKIIVFFYANDKRKRKRVYVKLNPYTDTWEI